MKTADFDFELPESLIAQEPLPERSASRMMVVDRAAGTFSHRSVRELPELLDPGDLMVFNNTRVFPARVFGRKCDTGGRVEVLLVERIDAALADHGAGRWDVYYKASGTARPGDRFELARGRIQGVVRERKSGGRAVVELASGTPLLEILESDGAPPLPPYIKRQPDQDARTAADRERYQTIYARATGAVAAPTAGLHFSPDLFAALDARGVRRTEITLHVGPGTFKPVKTDDPREHVMESERYEIPESAAEAVRSARARNARVLAVGSTSVRTLETMAADEGTVRAGEGRSSLFIYPSYRFRAVDAMLTNFHLPRSSLLMMVSALAGRELILSAYREAVREQYRFYSYGDCMLILDKNEKKPTD